MQNWEDHITSSPEVCHGTPCIKGTRVMVSVVLDNLADGLSPIEITQEYPALTEEDVHAALAYAAALTREEEMAPLR